MDNFPSLAETVAYARARVAALPRQELQAAGIERTPLEYYLTGTYPPLKALGEVEPEEVFANATETQNVYLHTPFCEQYCTFCHFFKEINPSKDRVTDYLRTLRKDMGLVTAQLGHRVKASTVYFGGGTPSFMTAHQMRETFAELHRQVDITPETEITFELHPGLVRRPDYVERLETLIDLGVNRWVFGIQSMDPDVLLKLNRGHGREEVYRLLALLGERNLDNLSVDLIFGLPYQTLENWHSTVRDLLDAGVDKFNIFPLMFKRSDPITKQYSREPEIFPDGTDRLVMHYMTEYMLNTVGFSRGPLFYYSKRTHHSLQQESKFDSIEDTNLLPFGVSGFGYVGGTQYYNYCTMDEYSSSVERGRPPVWRGWTLSNEERARRGLMFGLRSSGVRIPALSELHGVDVAALLRDELALLTRLDLITVEAGVTQLTETGAAMADGTAMLFASAEVLERALETNRGIVKPSVDPLDRYDYSPIGRVDALGGIDAFGPTLR